jgi:hypothetical protein
MSDPARFVPSSPEEHQEPAILHDPPWLGRVEEGPNPDGRGRGPMIGDAGFYGRDAGDDGWLGVCC